jgi:fluoride exporter
MRLTTLSLIFLGGGLGSVARYLTGVYASRAGAWPWGTFMANVIGCLLIGLFYGLANRYQWFTPELRFLLATGFCGGYTTFSTFAYENLQLLQNQQYGWFVGYSISSFVFGLAAVWVGLALTRL